MLSQSLYVNSLSSPPTREHDSLACSSTTEHPLPSLSYADPKQFLTCAPPPLLSCTSPKPPSHFKILSTHRGALETQTVGTLDRSLSLPEWQPGAGSRARVWIHERCGMLELLMSLLSSCWNPLGHNNGDSSGSGTNSSSFSREGKDGLLWFRDIGKYAAGEFSMAVVQANQVLEDQSQIESGQFGTFVGVYDGHGGPEAARYVCDNLFRNFQAISADTQGVVTSETIRQAFLETEAGFTSLVSNVWRTRPNMATVGSCCLVGVISHRTLFIANLGDSRVVLGKKVGNTGVTAAIQLSAEHNVNIESVRQELEELHPNDPQIVVLRHGVWRVKGVIQVSRSIGDVYLKDSQFNREPINSKFRLPEPFDMPLLSANPTIISHPLHPNDCFLIFASDGLWEHLTNEKAVEIVHSNPRAGSAKRLVKAALQEAARKREMRYSDLRKIDKKVRRHFHDDITVIVLFLNHDLISRDSVQDPPLSVRSALEH